MDGSWEWREEYDGLASRFIEMHFGRADGVTRLFPYMKPSFGWKDKSLIPADVRTVAKNNVEYHGLEDHARQYHLSGMYREAYEFWLMAACWRRENMRANGFDDERHLDAVAFCLRNAHFNRDLAAWQRREGPLVGPEEYGLDEKTIAGHDRRARRQINGGLTERGQPAPFSDE